MIYKKYFSEKWIKLIDDLYFDMLDRYKSLYKNWNTSYFNSPAQWCNRNSKHVLKKETEYFRNLLHYPNIIILKYILHNLEEFQNYTFLDCGSGFGLLSIFLRKLNIKCYNYDNFSQLGDISFNDEMFFRYFDIDMPKRTIPNDKIDVITTSSIWIDDKQLLNYDYEYMMLDSFYIGSKRVPTQFNEWIKTLSEKYDLIKKSGLNIYKLKD